MTLERNQAKVAENLALALIAQLKLKEIFDHSDISQIFENVAGQFPPGSPDFEVLQVMATQFGVEGSLD